MGKEHWIFVTGADQGLGLEFCREFLDRGYSVIGAGHRANSPDLKALKEQWGEKMEVITLDVASRDSVERSVEQVKTYTDNLPLLRKGGKRLGYVSSEAAAWRWLTGKIPTATVCPKPL